MDNSHRQLEILFLPLLLLPPLSSAVAAMFPRQSGFRGRTPLLCLLIHSRLETWTQTQLHIVWIYLRTASKCMRSSTSSRCLPAQVTELKEWGVAAGVVWSDATMARCAALWSHVCMEWDLWQYVQTILFQIQTKNDWSKYQIQNWNKKNTCLFVYNTLRFFLSDKVCLFPASFAVALLVLCLRCQLFWLQFWHKFHVWVGFSGVPSYWLIWFDWQLSRTTTSPGSWNTCTCSLLLVYFSLAL